MARWLERDTAYVKFSRDVGASSVMPTFLVRQNSIGSSSMMGAGDAAPPPIATASRVAGFVLVPPIAAASRVVGFVLVPPIAVASRVAGFVLVRPIGVVQVLERS